MSDETDVPPSGIEESLFKRVPDGWLFAAPRPWPFSPRPIYRVSEARKAALVARLRQAKYLRIFLIILLVVPAVALVVAQPVMLDPASPWGWLLLGGLMAIFFVIGSACDSWILNRPLRGLRPTDARITFGDRLRMQAEAQSLGTHILLAVVFFGAALSAAYRVAVPIDGPSFSPVALAAAVASALMFARSMMLIAVRLTRSQNEST